MNEKEKLLDDFINYFNNEKSNQKKGKKFEKFCKIFLQWLDFDDIKITPISHDGGIDLNCTKTDKLEKNKIDYVVQAKCYSKTHKIDGDVISALKGRKEVPLATRRICITTSDFTKAARNEANDENCPVILINGNDIIFQLKLIILFH